MAKMLQESDFTFGARYTLGQLCHLVRAVLRPWDGVQVFDPVRKRAHDLSTLVVVGKRKSEDARRQVQLAITKRLLVHEANQLKPVAASRISQASRWRERGLQATRERAPDVREWRRPRRIRRSVRS